MALVRWRDRGELSPWSALRDLESQFNRVFGDFGLASSWMVDPPVDITETKDAYVLEADLPGISKSDIEVTCVDNVVTIKGERKHEAKTENSGGYRSERRYGAFQRSFEVPNGFDPERVQAEYTNGELRITLPKREESKPKQIDVVVH